MPSRLFSPLTQRSLTFRNRIVVAPMCQYSATDGFADEWHLVHLGSRAVGGAGAVLVEATAVRPEGRITPGDLGLWSDAHVEPLSRITSFVRAHGCAAGVQLAHAGRKASTREPWNGGTLLSPEAGGWVPDAPSAVAFSDAYALPNALDEAGVARVIESFRNATKRALAAGFEFVEVHAAHGYLLHEFLSPLANQRSDSWGGALENRMRLTLEVTRAVREAWPADKPVWVRVSATDWADGGWNVDETVRLAQALKALGVDLVDCSSGGLVALQKIPLAPGYQVTFAERVKREAGVATGAVGLITEPKQAEAILAEGKADVVLLARQLLRDPYWPLRAAADLGGEHPWPVQYLRAK